MALIAVHGFLGLPRDWSVLAEAGFDVRALDVYTDDVKATLAAAGAEDVMVGYSMGGRLVLESLAAGARPQAAVIVSAGLGIESPVERDARAAADEVWARRFETDRWSEVLRDWNAQPIFGKVSMKRDEQDFDRALLARTLRRYSPAVTPPLERELRRIPTRLLWVAGQKDHKYVAVARQAVELLPSAQLWICPGAAHRVPWEQPERFVARVREFIVRAHG